MKRLMPTAHPLVACLTATAACSCSTGALSGSTDRPSVLATIHGTVEASPSGSPASNDLSVAIAWQKLVPGPVPRTPAPSNRVVSTSVPVKPTFPSSFSLDLTGLPPDSAMTDLAEFNCGNPPCNLPDAGSFHLWVAVGLLVVYEDLNHNGQLDLVAAGAPAYVDRVVGGSAPRAIIYIEKVLPQDQGYFPIPGADGSVLQAGYNWMRGHPWDCEPEDAGLDHCHTSIVYRPIDTPVTLSMFDLPREQPGADAYMCAVIPSFIGPQSLGSPPLPLTQESAGDFGGPLPSSEDPDLLCDSPTSFRYNQNCTTTSAGVCLAITTTCTQQVQVTLAPGTAAPTDWPCVPQLSF